MDKALIQFFSSLAPFSDEELDEAGHCFRLLTLQKHHFFSKAGRISDSIAFVKEGILRSFYRIKDKETTTFFQVPGSIAVALPSFLQLKPAFENIQAITEAQIMVISRKELYQLYGEHWKWQQVGRIVMEQYYIHLEQRMITLQTLSAHERYALFSTSYPELILSVPLQYIASYLNVSPETLSRIRKSV